MRNNCLVSKIRRSLWKYLCCLMLCVIVGLYVPIDQYHGRTSLTKSVAGDQKSNGLVNPKSLRRHLSRNTAEEIVIETVTPNVIIRNFQLRHEHSLTDVNKANTNGVMMAMLLAGTKTQRNGTEFMEGRDNNVDSAFIKGQQNNILDLQQKGMVNIHGNGEQDRQPEIQMDPQEKGIPNDQQNRTFDAPQKVFPNEEQDEQLKGIPDIKQKEYENNVTDVQRKGVPNEETNVIDAHQKGIPDVNPNSHNPNVNSVPNGNKESVIVQQLNDIAQINQDSMLDFNQEGNRDKAIPDTRQRRVSDSIHGEEQFEVNIPQIIRQYESKGYADETPLNTFDFGYSINPKQVCAGQDNIRLVFVVKTSSQNRKRRQTIRETWANSKRFGNIKTVFSLGIPQSVPIHDLYEESETYNDILLADYIDDYYNLTLKTIVGMRWVVKYCPRAQFAVSVDDDVYVSTDLMLKYLAGLPSRQLNKLYAGHLFNKS